MQCEHDHLIGTPEEACIAAKRILSFATPELVGDFMTALGSNLCCGAVGYAQYLMANAMRHELRERP